MPAVRVKKSSKFKIEKRHCLVCKKRLQLNNTRDIERKKFCSQKCMGYYVGVKRAKRDPQFYEEFVKRGNAPETRAKKSHKCENNPRWIKDRSKLKDKRMHSSPEVKRWRTLVFERDNFTCIICGEVGGALNAHHILDWENYPNERFDISNGVTMCYSCHKEFHRKNIVRKVG